MKTDEIKVLYDDRIQSKFANKYEYERWFATPISHGGYVMTQQVLERIVIPFLSKKEYMCELGPGPGTWTKILLQQKNSLHVDVVDISEKMLEQARKNLSDYSRVTYVQSDFLNFSTEKKYDSFFSSRAIEYFPDKDIVCTKINHLLKQDGACVIITKMPKYWAYRIRGKVVPEMHRNQITDTQLTCLLEQNGFEIAEVRPVMVVFPFLKSAWMNMILYRILSKFRMNVVSRIFSESYCVMATKI